MHGLRDLYHASVMLTPDGVHVSLVDDGSSRLTAVAGLGSSRVVDGCNQGNNIVIYPPHYEIVVLVTHVVQGVEPGIFYR